MANGKFLFGKPSGGVTTVTVADGSTNTNLVLPESGTVSSVNSVVTDNAIARYDGTTGKLQDSGVIIDDSGNVEVEGNLGVGTSNPGAKLEVSSSNSLGAILRTQMYNSSDTAGEVKLEFGFANHGGAGISCQKTGIANQDDLVFFTEYGYNFPVERLRIKASGDVLLTSGTGGLGYGPGAGGTVTQLTSKGTSVTLNKPVGKITTHNATLAAGDSVLFPVYNSLVTGNDLVYVLGDGNIINVTAYEIEVVNITSSYFYIKITNRTAGSLSEAIPINFFIIKGAIA